MRYLLLAGIALPWLLGGCSASSPRSATPSQPHAAEEVPCASDGKPCNEAASAEGLDSAHDTRNAAAAIPDEEEASGDEGVDDDAEASQTDEPGQQRAHPLDHWSREQIEQTVVNDPKALGPMSIGAPNGGALFNGVPMPEGEDWTLVDPTHAWGTQETTDALAHCIKRVRTRFPDTAPMYIGHISGPKGGHLYPHRSHQSGRDVDVGYYYQEEVRWYTRATTSNLDRARTWAFVRDLITETDVEYIFIDRSIQKLLRNYAESIGEPKAWVDSVFDGAPGLRPIVQHAKGHATHIHIRFYNPVAQETGRRVYALLVDQRLVTPSPTYVRYVAQKGDSLERIAKRFGTTPKAIQAANRLRSTLIRAGIAYRVARRGGISAPGTPTLIPARRLPASPSPLPLAATGGGANVVAASSAAARPAAAYTRPPAMTASSGPALVSSIPTSAPTNTTPTRAAR